MKTFRTHGKPWRITTALLLTLLLLTSTTGCSRSSKFIVIEGEETIQVRKATLDTLYRDNERLLRALEECGD